MNTPHIPEQFLRQIWQHQRFATGHLRTSDGRKVEILSPGVSNSDGGPDFAHAKIRIGNITFHGDVELHQDADEWIAHLHQEDQHYNRVILHVVLTAHPLSPPSRTASKRFLPLLVLHPYLDDTLRATWMKAISDERNERRKTIPCCALNDDVPADLIRRWIERLAHERMELKIRRFEERLKELIDEEQCVVREPYPRYYGSPDDIPAPTREYSRRDYANKSLWEQLLYEAIMEGFGYSKNTEPFLALAQSMRLRILRHHGISDVHALMALLFGAAGLLPSERLLPDKNARLYVRALKQRWKTLRPSYKGALLQPGDWLFFRLRPGNFPTARLASMCFIIPSLFGEGGFRSLITLVKREDMADRKRKENFVSMFKFTSDEFWRHHYRFDQRPSATGLAVGTERVNDILINGILPIILLYARIFKDHDVRVHALTMLASLPPPQDNAITRVMQQQLLKKRLRFTSALTQQGGIHLFKLFCAPGRCTDCHLGRYLGFADRGAARA